MCFIVDLMGTENPTRLTVHSLAGLVYHERCFLVGKKANIYRRLKTSKRYVKC